MRRTTEPPKTNITAIAASLITAAFVMWMASFAAQTDSIYSQGAPAPASLHAANAHDAGGPHAGGLKAGDRRLS